MVLCFYAGDALCTVACAGVDTGEAVVTGRVWRRGKAEELRKLAARAGRGVGRGGHGRGRAHGRGGRCVAYQTVHAFCGRVPNVFSGPAVWSLQT